MYCCFCSGGDKLLTRALHFCANISFSDPGYWHEIMLEAAARGMTHGMLSEAAEEEEDETAEGPSRREKRDHGAVGRVAEAALLRPVGPEGGIEEGGDGGMDPIGQVLAAMAAQVEGPLTPAVFFERFVVFDPRRNKVRGPKHSGSTSSGLTQKDCRRILTVLLLQITD